MKKCPARDDEYCYGPTFWTGKGCKVRLGVVLCDKCPWEEKRKQWEIDHDE